MSLALEEVESCTAKPKSAVAEHGHIKSPLGQSK
jgi:hypothetical protein